MASFSISAASLLAATLVVGPGDPVGPDDPVGIDDVSTDAEPGPGQLSVELSRWEALRALADGEAVVVPPPGPWAAEREVQIQRDPAGVRVRVSWELEAIEAGWLAGPLVGIVDGLRVESATWRGQAIGVTHTPAGEEVAVWMPAASRGRLELVAFIPGDGVAGGSPGEVDIWLMPAVRGEVELDASLAPDGGQGGHVPELVADGEARRAIEGRLWGGEAQLSLRWVEPTAADDRAAGPLAVAQTTLGLTFADAEVRARAHVSWLLRRGQLERVSLDTAGLGRDLEVRGPNVLEWTRVGDRIEIELKDAADGRVDVDLSWTQGLPSADEAKLPAPRIEPGQAYRSESYMQIARDGELEVLPALRGWSAVARAELPDWATADVLGTATATFRRDSPDPDASFELLRFVPVSGPPVVVDVAAYEIATTAEGRSLVQARYDVRNERASHLRVELPAGARMLGVRVNGETVTPAKDAGADRVWRIPLVRSLETVKGSLSFPVEVIFIGEADAWERKEARDLPLPALDAPVAVSRVRVYLPPRYQNRVDLGDDHRVDDFSEGAGITYGLGVGAGDAAVARADELYREATSAWMSNDFRRAQSSLDELGALGASNTNIDGLQANLDLVQGRAQSSSGSSSGSEIAARRIKDQAKRRAVDDEIVLLEKAQEAEELEAKGDYDKAEQTLAEAKEIGDRLALLEQSESQEQAVYNQVLSSSSARVAEKKKRKVSREFKAEKKPRVSGKVAGAKTAADDDVSRYDSNAFAQGITGEGDYELDGANIQPTTGMQPPAPPMTSEAPAPEPEPEPEPVSTPSLVDAPEQDRPDEGVILALEDAKSLWVGASTSRDFTAVVDVQAGQARTRPGRASASNRRRERATKPPETKNTATASPAEANADVSAQRPAGDPNAALDGPVATASAVAVHVPAVGEAVLYQHMLLPVGEPLSVHLEARRRRNSNR